MGSFTKKAVVTVGAVFAWLFCVVGIGVPVLMHGIIGYRCPDIQPGESCSFTSVRGTVRVPYEELGRVSVFSILLGAAILIGSSFLLWRAVISVWKGRSATSSMGNEKPTKDRRLQVDTQRRAKLDAYSQGKVLAFGDIGVSTLGLLVSGKMRRGNPGFFKPWQEIGCVRVFNGTLIIEDHRGEVLYSARISEVPDIDDLLLIVGREVKVEIS